MKYISTNHAYAVLWTLLCCSFLNPVLRANPTSPAGSNQGFQIKTEVIPLDIWFGEGKAVLKRGPHNTPVIKSLAKKLDAPNIVHLQIEGSPDPTASGSANKDLSLRRAEALSATISDMFKIPAGRIQVQSAGTGDISKRKSPTSDQPAPIYVIIYRIDSGSTLTGKKPL